MVEKPALTRLLKANASLSDEAALVYKYILMVGSLTVGEISEYTSYNYEVASKALQELTDGKLIRKLQHVVERYVAVAPYRAFAENLVDFQRTVRDVEENAKRSIDSALAEMTRVNEEWKANSVKLRGEEVSRAKQEIAGLRKEANDSRRSLVEKLRQETETKKSGISDTLKKHVDEHAARISETKKDITIRVDNSIARFAETTAKLKEEAAQSSSTYLNEFDEKTKLFTNSVRDDLKSFQSSFTSSTEKLRVETSSFLDDSSAKIAGLAETVGKKASELMRGTGETFTQISELLEGNTSSSVNSTADTLSSGNRELESNLTIVIQTHDRTLGEGINQFQTKTRETIDEWSSSYKNELQSYSNTLNETNVAQLQNLSQKMESTQALMSELLTTYLTNASGASDKLGSNVSDLSKSLKVGLTSGISAARDDLQESCDASVKDCASLTSALGSLSKKQAPLASKVIKDFTSEASVKMSKMMEDYIENLQSFAQEVRQKAIEAVSLAEIKQSAGTVQPKTGHMKKAGETLIDKDKLLKNITGIIDKAANSYTAMTKRSIPALDKYASEKISSVSAIEKEIAERWEDITDVSKKVIELGGNIKSFPTRIGEIIDEMSQQYGEKVDEQSSSTKRLLNTYSSSMGEGVNSALKKWSTAIERTKKELSDVTMKRQNEVAGLVSKHTGMVQAIAGEMTKELADLVSSKTAAFRSENVAAQANLSRLLASNAKNCGDSLKELESKLNNALEASVIDLRAGIESRCKANDESSALVIGETMKTVSSLKEQSDSVIKGGAELIRQVCETANLKLGETASENSKALHDVVTSLTTSFNEIIDAANEGYEKESESTKQTVTTLLSEHLKNYTDAVNKINGEINITLSKHFDDCSEMTGNFGKRLDELLTMQQNNYEKASDRMVQGLTNCIDRNEAAIKAVSAKMLREFTDNTTMIAKEANSVENLMRTAWTEITDTQQINADKTWHYVTKRAILNHIKDMVGRSKSTVTIVLPNLDEAPISEIKRISKAIRINIVAGIDEALHKNLLRELLNQGNVRIWNFPERNYVSCTRDAEEVLIAPIAPKDVDCIATVSVEEGFIKLIMKIVGPMWLASSKEVRSLASH